MTRRKAPATVVKAANTASTAAERAPRGQKRQRSSLDVSQPRSQPQASTPSTRSSKRVKSISTPGPNAVSAAKKNVTPTRSAYFKTTDNKNKSKGKKQRDGQSETEDQKGEEEDEDEEEEEGEKSSTAGGSESESGYEDEDATATEPSETQEESEGFDSEEDRKPRSKKRKTNAVTAIARRVRQKAASSTVAAITAPEDEDEDREEADDNDNGGTNKKDLWREGVKTGLGPGKAVFIAKPKPRGDGGVKYVPERIHPNTFSFLRDLQANNDREWLKAHDADYRQSWRDWESFVETLTERIVEVDDTVPELPPKDLVFRIYRDIRFSSDPTPYKQHFSAAWSRTGRKGPYACYYVQIQPGGRSFVGSGLWHPDAAPLALLRQDIDARPERIRGVLVDPALRKEVFGGVGRDEKKAIEKFAEQNAENALKTKPKGYEVNHPNIELLRLRNFTVGNRLSDDQILSPSGLDSVVALIQAMKPFVTYLNGVVMPDRDDEDENDNEQDSAEESSSENERGSQENDEQAGQNGQAEDSDSQDAEGNDDDDDNRSG